MTFTEAVKKLVDLYDVTEDLDNPFAMRRDGCFLMHCWIKGHEIVFEGGVELPDSLTYVGEFENPRIKDILANDWEVIDYRDEGEEDGDE